MNATFLIAGAAALALTYWLTRKVPGSETEPWLLIKAPKEVRAVWFALTIAEVDAADQRTQSLLKVETAKRWNWVLRKLRDGWWIVLRAAHKIFG